MVDTMPPGIFNEHTTKAGFGKHYSIQMRFVNGLLEILELETNSWFLRVHIR